MLSIFKIIGYRSSYFSTSQKIGYGTTPLLYRLLSSKRGIGIGGAETKSSEKEKQEQIRTSRFYEEQAARRRYFYHVDLHGRLFLEGTTPRNIATCLKDPKFLNFFFSRIRRNRLGIFGEYSHISPCGREMNFIESADTVSGPFVFRDLIEIGGGGKGRTLLAYGGESTQPLRPDGLVISEETGRMYHPLERGGKRLPDQAPVDSEELGLIRSHLALALSEHIVFREPLNLFVWRGQEFPIKKI
mmetsp:Transcript_7545/g.15659  ORF Transcript_7545/g.15659 Transcript_7545/m.15659 type:complete len:244 (-) Transcript_7545:419-1150(-)